MPLTIAERANLDQATAAATQAQQVVAGLVAALVADPEPNPLQVALDAMTAERNALAQSLQTATADLISAVDQRNALQAKLDAKNAAMDALDAADAAADAAEAAEDAARIAARNAGE